MSFHNGDKPDSGPRPPNPIIIFDDDWGAEEHWYEQREFMLQEAAQEAYEYAHEEEDRYELEGHNEDIAMFHERTGELWTDGEIPDYYLTPADDDGFRWVVWERVNEDFPEDEE